MTEVKTSFFDLEWNKKIFSSSIKTNYLGSTYGVLDILCANVLLSLFPVEDNEFRKFTHIVQRYITSKWQNWLLNTYLIQSCFWILCFIVCLATPKSDTYALTTSYKFLFCVLNFYSCRKYLASNGCNLLRLEKYIYQR